MPSPKVIIVVLRRPNRANHKEMRTDPLWEFGSFGCTGCHSRNLMNPNSRKVNELHGARLAFAQGGRNGFKLVYLTPPIRIVRHGTTHGTIAEAKWSHAHMPLKYIHAPLFIRNDGNSDFPLLKNFVKRANCPSWEARFASKFRARRRPLDAIMGEEIVEIFGKAAKGSRSVFATNYVDAMDEKPPKPDNNRQLTYDTLLNTTRKRKACK